MKASDNPGPFVVVAPEDSVETYFDHDINFEVYGTMLVYSCYFEVRDGNLRSKVRVKDLPLWTVYDLQRLDKATCNLSFRREVRKRRLFKRYYNYVIEISPTQVQLGTPGNDSQSVAVDARGGAGERNVVASPEIRDASGAGCQGLPSDSGPSNSPENASDGHRFEKREISCVDAAAFGSSSHAERPTLASIAAGSDFNYLPDCAKVFTELKGGGFGMSATSDGCAPAVKMDPSEHGREVMAKGATLEGWRNEVPGRRDQGRGRQSARTSRKDVGPKDPKAGSRREWERRDDRKSFSFEIAGTSHYRKASDHLISCSADDLRAMRKPKNRHDSNAVAIYTWYGLVGYVPRAYSGEVAPLMDSGWEVSFENLRPYTYYKKKKYRDDDGSYYWDEDYDNAVVTADVTLVCTRPYEEGKESEKEAGAKGVTPKLAEVGTHKPLSEAEFARAVKRDPIKSAGLNDREVTTLFGIQKKMSRAQIAEEQGWTYEATKSLAKSAYKKLGIHRKADLDELLRSSSKGKAGDKEKPQRAKRVRQGGLSYVGIADFLVRSHRSSCGHGSHKMAPVEASVTIMTSRRRLEERKFRAFYCEKCDKYFVTETTFERLKRAGHLCCKVIGIGDLGKQKAGSGRWAAYAEESTLHLYGYNVNKEVGLSAGERQAILSFVIENGIMSQYAALAFIQGLISNREGMQNMADAIAKWREDVRFLEQYRPPVQSLKVGKLYARKSRLL